MTEPEDRIRRLSRIAGKVAGLVPAAIVFGSAARGESPNDLDVFAEIDPASREARALLALARANYGWLDVFVRSPHGGSLLVRDEWATGWAVAKRAREIGAAIRRDGIPVSELKLRVPGADGDRDPSTPAAPCP